MPKPRSSTTQCWSSATPFWAPYFKKDSGSLEHVQLTRLECIQERQLQEDKRKKWGPLA